MHILITGNLGYVGTVTCAVLQNAGHSVTGFDIGYFADGTISAPRPPDRQILADVRTFEASALKDIDAVVHLAALSNDPLGEIDTHVTGSINVGGLDAVAQAARAAGIERFVFASSCSLYGKSDGDALLDEDARQNPLTAYARSKLDGEALLRELGTEAFRPISLRFSTAYGYSPRLRLDLVVNNLVASALANGVIVLDSDGTPWRPLVHVEDMAQAIQAAIESNIAATGANAYNVGLESENYQIRTLAQTVSDALGGLPLSIKPIGQGGDQRSYNVAFARFRAAFPAFAPTWNVVRGVDDLVVRLRAAFDPADFTTDRYFRIRKINSLLAGGRIDPQLRLAPAEAGKIRAATSGCAA